MPLYKLSDVQSLIASDDWEYATKACRTRVQSLGMSRSRVAEVVLALTQQDFRKVFGTAGTDWGDVEADDYVIWFDEVGGCRCAPDKGDKFYVKFAIETDATGSFLLLIQFHLASY